MWAHIIVPLSGILQAGGVLAGILLAAKHPVEAAAIAGFLGVVSVRLVAVAKALDPYAAMSDPGDPPKP
jgi:hypothetical protein